MRMDFKIEQHDVAGLVHSAWLHFFAKVESSKRPIAERGWNPLTYNLLDHRELNRTKDNNLIDLAYQLVKIHGKENLDPTNLNFNSGVAKSLMDKIVEQWMTDKALEQACHDQADDIQSHKLEIFNKLAFNSGHMYLSNGAVHN